MKNNSKSAKDYKKGKKKGLSGDVQTRSRAKAHSKRNRVMQNKDLNSNRERSAEMDAARKREFQKRAETKKQLEARTENENR